MLAPGMRLEKSGIAIVRRLGSGGMGVVFEGRQEGLERRVAVKVLLGDAAGGAEALQAARRLADEARAASAIVHPNVLQVLLVDEDPTAGLCVVYEFAAGGSLRDRLVARRAAPWPEALLEVGGPLLAGLEALHAAHVVHRDVKPENVLCGEAGAWKVGDLGLAWFEGRQADTATGCIVATPGYAAPEQLFGTAPPTPATDVFAAALVLVEAVTGVNPLRGATLFETVALYRGVPLGAADLARHGVPAGACAPLARALALEPAARTPSAAQLARELRAGGDAASCVTLVGPRFALGAVTEAERRPPAPAARRPLALVAVPALVLAVVGFLALGPRTAPDVAAVATVAPAAAPLLDPDDLPPTATALDGVLAAYEAAGDPERRLALARAVEKAPDRTGCLRALGRELRDLAEGSPPTVDRAGRLLAGVRAAREARAGPGRSAPERFALECWFWKRVAELAMAGHLETAARVDEQGLASQRALAAAPAAVVTSPWSEGVLAAVALTRSCFAVPRGDRTFDPTVLLAALARQVPPRYCPAPPGGTSAADLPLSTAAGEGPEVDAALMALWNSADAARNRYMRFTSVEYVGTQPPSALELTLREVEANWWGLVAANTSAADAGGKAFARALLAELSDRLWQMHPREGAPLGDHPRGHEPLLSSLALALRVVVDTRRLALAVPVARSSGDREQRLHHLLRAGKVLAVLAGRADVRGELRVLLGDLEPSLAEPEVRVLHSRLSVLPGVAAPLEPAALAATVRAVAALVSRVARQVPSEATFTATLETTRRAFDLSCLADGPLHGSADVPGLFDAYRAALRAASNVREVPVKTRSLLGDYLSKLDPVSSR